VGPVLSFRIYYMYYNEIIDDEEIDMNEKEIETKAKIENDKTQIEIDENGQEVMHAWEWRERLRTNK